MLRSAGIPCFVPDANFTNLVGGQFGVLVTSRVLVWERDLEDARAILADILPDQDTPAGDLAPTQTEAALAAFARPACPRCGSADISSGFLPQRRLLTVLFYLSGIFSRREMHRHRCRVCQHEWRA